MSTQREDMLKELGLWPLWRLRDDASNSAGTPSEKTDSADAHPQPASRPSAPDLLVANRVQRAPYKAMAYRSMKEFMPSRV